MQAQYSPHTLEPEIQACWQQQNAFAVKEDAQREKFYCLSMFPYPSGKLHMGHVRNYAIGDVISRYQRMQGKNVLQPMGWDAFGLPAENAAISNRSNPAQWTRKNIAEMRAQLQRLGFAYDWGREFATCDLAYYRWEQWFFLQLYQHGLVYRKTATVNWDPVDCTVLANEQVIDGKGWRSGAVVETREIPQWFLKITDYAEELLADLEKLPGWSDSVRLMQKNWIGRSEGVEFDLEVPGNDPLRVYTTRPDTIMGMTYCAVATEHPLALKLAEKDVALQKFIASCKQTSVSEAVLETREKQGVALDVSAIHPLSGQPVPIYCADFVLMSYGTGAVMAVPAHDQRDYEFARKYNIPVTAVIRPADQSEADISAAAFTDHGICYHSGEFDGLDFNHAFTAICARLQQTANGEPKVNYRLRDWGISRQRYWGCPIPALHIPTDTGATEAIPLPADELPVELPEEVSLDGVHSPLGTHPEFRQVPGHAGAVRETDTFDTFFESSWYYARYCCADNDTAMLDERVNYWLPVDQYIGGVEHAVLHLLYARFFHKLLRDFGLVTGDEPFTRLLTQGMVLKDGQKMSKSRGNTVDPQALIERYGADTVRLFMMSAAPPEQSLEWSDAGVDGAARFLHRLWRFFFSSIAEQSPPPRLEVDNLDATQRATRSKIHQTIAKVDDELGRRYKFNTAIAAIIELVNHLTRLKSTDDNDRALIREGLEVVTLLLAPIVPHICEIFWQELGYTGMVIDAPWPQADAAFLVMEEYQMAVQVNGKLRALITVAQSLSRTEMEKVARANENVQRFIADREVVKVIAVPGRLLNFVVKETQ